MTTMQPLYKLLKQAPKTRDTKQNSLQHCKKTKYSLHTFKLWLGGRVVEPEGFVLKTLNPKLTLTVVPTVCEWCNKKELCIEALNECLCEYGSYYKKRFE